MSASTIADVTNQVQKFWAPVFTKQLRSSLLLGGLVNKEYQGVLKNEGDTVRVSQINAPTGELLTVGTNADAFNPESISTSYVDVTADKRAVASYEFQDLVWMQSQVTRENPEVMEALQFAVASQINSYLYSLAVASTSSPDHDISGVSDFNASQLSACRILAAQAKWRKEPGWYALLDPQYMGDVLNAATLTSSDYGATDAPVIGGQVALKRFGFNILEDNSLSADHGLLFHPDFLHMVMQSEVNFRISDMHAQKRFAYVMSVDVVFGAKLGNDGSKKCIRVYNSAW